MTSYASLTNRKGRDDLNEKNDRDRRVKGGVCVCVCVVCVCLCVYIETFVWRGVCVRVGGGWWCGCVGVCGRCVSVCVYRDVCVEGCVCVCGEGCVCVYRGRGSGGPTQGN